MNGRLKEGIYTGNRKALATAMTHLDLDDGRLIGRERKRRQIRTHMIQNTHEIRGTYLRII